MRFNKAPVYLLAFALLTSFAAANAAEPQSSQPSPYTSDSFSADVSLQTEYPVYGPDIETIRFTITNKTKKTLTYGLPYSLEVLRGGAWYVVPFVAEDPNAVTVFENDAFELANGATVVGVIRTASFWPRLSEGTYRIVKQIGVKAYSCQFQIGASAITAATPHGFNRLENLPASYSFDDAIAEGAYVPLSGEVGKVYNAHKVSEFIRKAALSMPCTLRVAEAAADGKPVVKDIIYGLMLGRHCYCVRTVSPRLGGKPTIEYFGAMSVAKIGGSERVVFSDYFSHAASAPADARYALISSAKESAADIAAVKKHAKTFDAAYRAACFSPNGKQHATLYCDAERREVQIVSAASPEALQILPPQWFSQITALRWLDDGRFEIAGVMENGKKRTAIYDMEVRDWVSVDVLPRSYSRIGFKKSTIRLTVKQSYYVMPDISAPANIDDYDLVLESSNPGVVAVESGLSVRAVSPGRATLYVRAVLGKASAKLTVLVGELSPKFYIYDAQEDLRMTARAAPTIDRTGMSDLTENLGNLKQSKLDKSDDPAGMYYALCDLMLGDGNSMRGNGLVLIDSAMDGCTEADMATMRTWLRKKYKDILLARADDLKTEKLTYEDMYEAGGALLKIGGAERNGDIYTIDGYIQYGDLGANGYRAIMQKTATGWRVKCFTCTWVS